MYRLNSTRITNNADKLYRKHCEAFTSNYHVFLHFFRHDFSISIFLCTRYYNVRILWNITLQKILFIDKSCCLTFLYRLMETKIDCVAGSWKKRIIVLLVQKIKVITHLFLKCNWYFRCMIRVDFHFRKKLFFLNFLQVDLLWTHIFL